MTLHGRASAACLIALWAATSPAAQGPPRDAGVDRGRLISDVRTLASPAFEGRATGTAGGIKARQWIVEQFQALRLTPAGTNGYLQPLRGGGANVIGRIAGRDPNATTIVVSAHYDHDGIKSGVLYPGADDNASGVATLLAIARHFTSQRPGHSLVVAAFDAEEDGLRGSRTFVLANMIQPSRIALNVNLDMVSRSAANEIFAAGTSHTPALKPILEDVQMRTPVRIRFGHDSGGGTDDWTTQSDHMAFHEAGVPFIYFGVENHADYHRPTDTPDKIDPLFFGDVVEMIIDAVRAFDARLD